FLLYSGPELIDEQSFRPVVPESYDSNQIDMILSRLSLEQKIGQMLIYGFRGENALSDAIPLINKYHAGGVVIFTHNVRDEAQISSLTRAIQYHSLKAIGIPSFIAIDQEGGKVLRLKNVATVLPGNMNLGATRSTTLSFLAGKLTAIDLEILGINMNFAPVLDVNITPDNEVIGVRSFGDDPAMVSRLGTAFIRGIQSRRVSATAKHFPGHGGTRADSHFGIPVLEHDWDSLKRLDLSPFISAIAEGVDAIMTAHIVLPKIDPTNTPATLSKKIITGILREALGYKGLIITDDMEMKAITKDMSIGEAAVQAVLAGCDMVTIVWTEQAKEDVYNSLLAAARTGRIPIESINESVKRILEVKIKRKLFEYPDMNIEEVRRIVGNKFHRQIAQLIAKKSITLVKNTGNVVPVQNGGNFVVLSPFSYFSTELKNRGLKTSFIKMDVNQRRIQRNYFVNKVIRENKNADAFIVAVVDRSQAQIAGMLKKASKKPVIVAALDSPYVYSMVKNADAYICSYSFRTQAIRALAGVISGNYFASGRLPVTVDIAESKEAL
ncbi:MAG: beta-N-acetylhexosaminidase, partial [Oligoflexia bacterium]|nr:beta-N-acetylhexosaminidase [Oligoflexia bacterium]